MPEPDLIPRPSRTLTAVAILLLVPLVAPDSPAQEAGRLDYSTFELDNGLRVIVAQDHSTPIAAVDVWYDVGSRNDPKGRSGFAHLFEHMMFEGTKHVGRTEQSTHMALIQRAGGSPNGTTAEDRTNYYQTVPANRLNLALWLEADRMRFLSVTRENFENQREVVKEERRQNVENAPYSMAFRKALVRPYDSETCFGYSRMGIGSMEDLNAATLEEVQGFYQQYYAPNNATLAVVGDVEPARVRELVERYFGGAEPANVPSQPDCRVSFDAGIRVDTVRDPNARLPGVFWAFRTPPHDHRDTYALTLLARILGEGQSSRLHRSMVQQAGAATQASMVYGSNVGWRVGPGLFLGLAFANQGVSADSLRALFQSELRRLREEPPGADELQKAKNAFHSDYVMGRQTVIQKAETLQHFALYHDDLSSVNDALDRFLAVTPSDLERVVDRYLTRENLTVMVDLPAAGGTGTEGGDPGDSAGSPGAAGPGGGGLR